MGKSDVVKVAIAGLGRSGWDHLLTMEQLPDKFKIAAVTDPMEERCKEACRKLQCRTCSDLDALIADPEVELVVVATPNRFHSEHTIKALRAGKDVVCEKPMAGNTAEADQMLEAASQTGQLLAIFQNRRYAPSFQKICEIIKSEKLGRIVTIHIRDHSFARRWDWQTLKEFGGGELNNMGSHFLDIALILFGPEEPEIFCHLDRTLTSGDADDHCNIILKGADAPMIQIEISRACAYPDDNWLILGTRGGLRGTFDKLKWKYTDFSKLPDRPVSRNPTLDRSYNSEELPWREESWNLPPKHPSGQTCFYNDLYQTLRNNMPLAITPQSVRRQIDILDKCRKSSFIWE